MVTRVVARNIEKMLGSREGEMQYLLMRESMGSMGHQAANFCYSPDGEIAYFENPQELPDKFKNLPRGTFEFCNGKIVQVIPPELLQPIIDATIWFNKIKSNP